MTPHGDPGRFAIKADLERFLNTESDLSGFRIVNIGPFGDGHSGVIYRVAIETPSGLVPYVLRTSAPGAPLKGPGDIGRQGRIMRHLASLGLPVPKVLALSSDGVIDGRSFALMELVEGSNWSETLRDHDDRQLASEAVKFLHHLQAEPQAPHALLGEKSLKPSDEVSRWSRLLPHTPEWVRAPANNLVRSLEENSPPRSTSTLVHGDFHFGNMIFNDGRLVAVVDWEIASVSDPLFDLACLAVASIRSKYEPEPNVAGNVAVDAVELASMYGVETDLFNWYVAATCLKYAAILGYNLNLHRSGKRIDPIYEDLLSTTRGLIDDGEAILAGTL